MANIPIIGDSTQDQPTNAEDNADVTMFHKAALVVMDENGECFFLPYDAPIGVFQTANTHDVLSMATRASHRIRDQELAAAMLRAQMSMAAQMQKHQQDQALLSQLNLKGAK